MDLVATNQSRGRKFDSTDKFLRRTFGTRIAVCSDRAFALVPICRFISEAKISYLPANFALGAI